MHLRNAWNGGGVVWCIDFKLLAGTIPSLQLYRTNKFRGKGICLSKTTNANLHLCPTTLGGVVSHIKKTTLTPEKVPDPQYHSRMIQITLLRVIPTMTFQNIDTRNIFFAERSSSLASYSCQENTCQTYINKQTSYFLHCFRLPST